MSTGKDAKAKMKELIEKKQGGGRSKKMETPKNDRKNMRKGPKIYNKQAVNYDTEQTRFSSSDCNHFQMQDVFFHADQQGCDDFLRTDFC